jgi:GTP-binding protein HflX
MRRLDLPEQGPIIFADTVGFISHLPHRLINAFRATLEEAAAANVLLHIIDASAEDRSTNVDRVNDVLKEIGAHELPTLLVYNKIDLMDEPVPRIDRDQDGKPVAVWLSALSGEGTELLLEAVAEYLPRKMIHTKLQLKPEQGAFRAALYNYKAVLNETYNEHGDVNLEIQLPESEFLRIVKQSGLKSEDLDPI